MIEKTVVYALKLAEIYCGSVTRGKRNADM